METWRCVSHQVPGPRMGEEAYVEVNSTAGAGENPRPFWRGIPSTEGVFPPGVRGSSGRSIIIPGESSGNTRNGYRAQDGRMETAPAASLLGGGRVDPGVVEVNPIQGE